MIRLNILFLIMLMFFIRQFTERVPLIGERPESNTYQGSNLNNLLCHI